MLQISAFILASLSVFLSSATYAADGDNFCEAALTAPGPKFEQLLAERRNKEEALKLLDTISTLEKKIQARRAFNGGYERKTVLRMRRRLNLLSAQIRLGEINAAIDLYRDLFRTTELSYWEITTKTVQLADLEKELATTHNRDGIKLANRLNDEIDEATETFGRLYGEYYAARSQLEETIADKSDPAEQATATSILKNLGTHNLTELVPQLGISTERPKLADMKALFADSPEAVIAKLKRDANEEFWTSVKVLTLSYPLIDALRSVVYKLPAQIRVPVSRILGIAYCIYLRDNYLPQIERIMDVESGTRAQLDLLRELNAGTSSDELLITFARLANGTGTWDEIKKQAIDLGKTSVMYKIFADRMGKAEVEAGKLGEIPLFEEPTPANRIMALGIPMTAIAAWAIQAHNPALLPFLEHLKTLLVNFVH